MINFFRKYPDYLSIILFIILSITTIIWFDGNNYLYQIDSLFNQNIKQSIYRGLFFWKDFYSVGYGLAEFNTISFYALQNLLSTFYGYFLGDWLGIVWSQKTIYILNLFFGFLGAYLFYKEYYSSFIGEKGINKFQIGGLLCVIFLILNPFTLTYVFFRYMTWFPFIAATPLVLYFYLRYLNSNKLKYILFIGLIFISPLGTGFPQIGFLVLLILLLIILVIYSLSYKEKIKSIIKKNLTFGIILFGLILWYIIPSIIGIGFTSDSSQSYGLHDNQSQLEYASNYTDLKNIFSLNGYYIFYSIYDDNFPFAWNSYFLNNPLLFLWIILIVIGIININKIRNQKKYIFALLIFLIFFVTLSKGNNPPFEKLGLLLLEIHPVIFRHAYDRFIYIIVFIFFLLLIHFHYLFSKKIIALLIVINFIIVIPFFLQSYIHQSDKIDLRNLETYNRKEEIIQKIDSNYRYIGIPFSDGSYSYNINNKVNHPNAKNLIGEVLGTNIVQFKGSVGDQNILSTIDSYINNGNIGEFKDFLGKNNFKYIVLNKLYSCKYNLGSFCDEAKKQVDFVQKLEMNIIYSNSEITIYELKENVIPILNKNYLKFSPVFYEINTNIANNNFGKLNFLQSFHPEWKLYLEPYSEIDCRNPNTYSGSLNQKTENYTIQAGDDYQKIVASQSGITLDILQELNPDIDERELKIGQVITLKKTAGESYSVTECESENRFYVGGELSKLWEKPIFDDTHTMVYGYANKWTIDPAYIKANYSKEYYRENPDSSIDVRMTLYFKPQSYFYLGLMISGTTLFLLLGYLGYDSVRNRRRRNPKIDISKNSV